MADQILEKQKVEFNNYLITFIENMISSPCLNKIYQKEFKKYGKYFSNQKLDDFVEDFYNTILPYVQEISLCYDGMFADDDPKFGTSKICLLYGIDFKDMWRTCQSTLTPEFKTQMWRDLKTLYIFSSYIVKTKKEFISTVKKHKTIIESMIQSLNEEKHIKAEAQKQIELEKLQEEADRIDFKKIFEIFGEDNHLTTIIVEIAKEINLSETFEGIKSDPLSAFSKLFSGNTDMLNGIIDKVKDKVQAKMTEKGITQEDLLADAKKLQETLFTKFKGLSQMAGLNDIGDKIYDYFKDMDLNMEKTEKSENTEGNTEGNGEENTEEQKITMERLQEEIKAFQEKLGEFGGAGNLDLNKLFSAFQNKEGNA